jgi:tetratricopeptide (TPR) repeat protein
MMNMKKLRKIAAILFLSAIFGSNLNAQTRNDVVNVYNEGAKAVQTDVKAAIEAFEKVVVLSDQVGETVADLKQKAVQVLPGLYVRVASNSLNEKKPSPETIKAAKKAVSAAEKYGSTTNLENARKILVQGYYNLGTEFFAKKDFENALLAFDSLLVINPDYLNAIYNKTLIFRNQNNSTAFEENIDIFLVKAKSINDTVKVQQASKLALEYFRASGSRSNQANKLDEAIGLLNKAAKYGDDKDLFYYIADVYNKQKNFDKGTDFAQKGLALETGGDEAKAKFYFQLALAQAGKGLTTDACASFKSAMFGVFAEPSKVQRTNLKCQ